jgi:SAM-dependent methyltransferase
VKEVRSESGLIILPQPPDCGPDYSAVWDYKSQPKEWVSLCGACRSPFWGGILGYDIDRYGYPVKMATCGECDVSYIKERMTPAAYAEFYASGAYRRLVSAYHGREINAETIQAEQRVYAEHLADRLAAHVEPWKDRGHCDGCHGEVCWDSDHTACPGCQWHLLDVGGSTGVVASVLNDRYELSATIVDPAVLETGTAKGMRVIPWPFEEWEPSNDRFDLITLCQTVDHLLDPMGAVRKIHGLLAPGGIFWLDALDYDRARQIKIDHPYNFTERTLRALVEKAGFAIVDSARDVSADGNHVGFVCRKAA